VSSYVFLYLSFRPAGSGLAIESLCFRLSIPQTADAGRVEANRMVDADSDRPKPYLKPDKKSNFAFVF
jgi:hypothetical protein